MSKDKNILQMKKRFWRGFAYAIINERHKRNISVQDAANNLQMEVKEYCIIEDARAFRNLQIGQIIEILTENNLYLKIFHR